MLTRKMQVGLLYSFYLARAGTATVHAAAKNLKLSKHFLAQVAWSLKDKNLIVSHKGPGGGYKLTPGVTVYDVLNALGSTNTFKKNVFNQLLMGGIEHRVLASLGVSIDNYMYPLYDVPIVKAVQMIINAELKILDTLPVPDNMN